MLCTQLKREISVIGDDHEKNQQEEIGRKEKSSKIGETEAGVRINFQRKTQKKTSQQAAPS